MDAAYAAILQFYRWNITRRLQLYACLPRNYAQNVRHFDVRFLSMFERPIRLEG